MLGVIAMAVTGGGLPDFPVNSAYEEGKVIASEIQKNDFAKWMRSDPGTARIKGLEAVWKKDAKAIGWWSDGFKKVPVEHAIRVTPELASRWMGYLSVRELWMEGEKFRRWESLQASVEGKSYFMVILSAFPTRGPLGLLDEEKTSDIETKDVRFAIDTPHGRVDPRAMLVHSRKAYGKRELDMVPWWEFTPMAHDLRFMFDEPYKAPMFSRGDYARSWWLVWVDGGLPDEVTLKVASQRKVRSAEFK